jgi:hypothetical protein
MGSIFRQWKNQLKSSNRRSHLSIDIEVRMNILLKYELISVFFFS